MAAQEEFEALLTREPAIPSYARYRVLSNLVAVHFAGNRYDQALEYARSAAALRPDDPKAQTNLAYAVLASGDREAAARRAQAVLALRPDNGPAASALLQARMRDAGLTDPFAIVPAEAQGSVEFKIGAIVFLRHRDDTSWRAFAAKAAMQFPGNDVLKRLWSVVRRGNSRDRPPTTLAYLAHHRIHRRRLARRQLLSASTVK